ncbi:SDR family oxidoreductase [Mesorhizobium sp. M0118]|uniref:SDR family oxidoreductase n=1 Tax=Mesorhizobium sp. M0118 TaxID=2956884 RepID=UPI003336E6FE
MGRDYSGEGVRVDTVKECDMPRTGFAVRGLNPSTAMAGLDDSVPLGRVVQPEDIDDVVLLLASDAARYMCSMLLEVNGRKALV